MDKYKLTPSFGRRKARKLRVHSHKAYEEILPLLKIQSRDALSEVHYSEVWLEIGFGGGEHLVEQLSQNPTVAIVGCEPFINGVANLVSHLSCEDYKRVKIWHDDVRYLLEMIPSSYFQRVFILFPDPWPKTRHHRRRLITKDFMSQLGPRLKEGAFLHIASDDPSYVEQIQDVLYNDPSFSLCEGPPSSNPEAWTPRPQGWPKTRYEQKALIQGKKCAYMLFQKKEIL